MKFLPRAWGNGLASSALTELLAWTWFNHQFESVIAVTQTANQPSIRLLERLGFAFEVEFEEWNAFQSRYRLLRPTLSD